MREVDLVRQARKYLENEGACVFKYFGTACGVVGFSDLFGVYKGRAFFIEIKIPPNEPTVHQALFLARVREKGAISLWCDSMEDLKIKWQKFSTG